MEIIGDKLGNLEHGNKCFKFPLKPLKSDKFSVKRQPSCMSIAKASWVTKTFDKLPLKQASGGNQAQYFKPTSRVYMYYTKDNVQQYVQQSGVLQNQHAYRQ